MSTVSERLLDRVRMDLGDLPQPFDFQFVGDGYRDHFYLEHRPINPTGLVVLHNGAVLVDPGFSGVTIDYNAGMMIFQTPPAVGDVFEVQGEKWRYFSDADLQIFLGTSITQNTYGRGDASGGDYTAGDIRPVEEYPIALYATIQALWALATDAAFDIDILAPDGVNIPRSERYRQLMEIIGARQTQYDEIAGALNIGVAAIEVFTARRTAKLTNRLIPVYLPAEHDDNSRPKRVLFPTPLLGSQPVETGIATYDVNVISGDPKSFILDFDFDLTDAIIKNAIRRSPVGSGTWPASWENPAPVVTVVDGFPNTTVVEPSTNTYVSTVGTYGPPVHAWTQEIIDAVNGKVRFSLTGRQTRTLPYNCYWEVQVQKAGEAEPYSKLRGLIRATNNEVVR